MMRHKFEVVNEGTEWAPEFVTEFNGERISASNPFLLDSLLSSAGAPMPRDLHLVEEVRDDG